MHGKVIYAVGIKTKVGTMGYRAEGYNPYAKVFWDWGYNIVGR